MKQWKLLKGIFFNLSRVFVIDLSTNKVSKKILNPFKGLNGLKKRQGNNSRGWMVSKNVREPIQGVGQSQKTSGKQFKGLGGVPEVQGDHSRGWTVSKNVRETIQGVGQCWKEFGMLNN